MTSTAPATHRPPRDASVPTAPVWRRHRVFMVAIAAVMLHVADDSFLQPNPGVSPTDHLVSGLVPLALLGLGAWAYPRVRAGARAVLALVIGLVGVMVGAIEVASHLPTVGPRGDDWSGMLATVAGFVLIGLGAVTLWRSRRPGPNRAVRHLRRVGIGVLGTVLVAELFVPFAFGYLSTHVARAELQTPHLGTAHEDVSFTTSDGLRLEGWYIPSRNGAAVIAFPGRKGPQAHARMLARHGYGVLLFDRRGEGASQGDTNLFGWDGSRDIHAAVRFLQDRPDVDPDRIGGIGFSVGGELMLQAAAENDELAAVVSEGAGTRSMSEELQEYDGLMQLRGLHAMAAKQAGVALFSGGTPPPSLVDLAPRIAPRPALLIWAPNGGNRETMSPEYARLIGPSATVWEMDDVKHIRGLQTHPEEYERRVAGFFDRALPPTG